MTATPLRPVSPAEVLAARLDDPRTAQALGQLLDHADLLAVLVSGLAGLAARGDTITESLTETLREATATAKASVADQAPGIDPAALLTSGVQLAQMLPKIAPPLTTIAESGALDHLLDSGVLTPTAIDQISMLAAGLVHGGERFATDPVPVGNAFSLLGLLKDPDINRALSFFATVAKAIGQQVAAQQTTTPTPTR